MKSIIFFLLCVYTHNDGEYSIGGFNVVTNFAQVLTKYVLWTRTKTGKFIWKQIFCAN